MTRRRKAEPTKVNHDRWLVSYADFITLLFGFFVVMYSVSQVNETKYKELSETLGAAFKNRTGSSAAPPGEEPQLASVTELQQRVEHALQDVIAAGDARVQATEEWVEISVDAGLLFESGNANPSAAAEAILADIGRSLAPYTNAVDVAGHTDNLPIHNSLYDNNWELSAARATRVVAVLSRHGIAPQRLSATGYGEFQPIADNTTEAGRAENRRVVLTVARHQAERPVVPAPGLVDDLAAQPAGQSTDATGVATARPEVNEAGGEQAATAPPENAAQENAVPEKAAPKQPLQPVILEDGGLLFTSDPELPRRRN